ncbi:VWA domain-containing protein [Candidatus Dependentiae bacterium]
MEYFLRFYNASWLYFLIPAVIVFAFLRIKWAKGVFYQYSLGSLIKKNGFASRHPYKKIFFLLRFLSLMALAFLIAKPQLVDPRSNVLIEGIDMVIVLDMSGSMELQDFGQESRFDVAKREAIRFIEKREHDPIGVVVFGNDSVSRCPITLDKTILKAIVKDLKIGLVDPQGTMLSAGLLTGLNRLKDSKSKNKIVILLTDGEPTENDVSADLAIEVAKKLGIKVYTVGIGSEEQKYFKHPLYGVVPMPKVNAQLLEKIAKETGGKFFMAKNKQDMRNIYKIIDKLEKTEYETNIYSKYFDIFMPFLWAVFIVLLLELFFALFIWFGI